MILKTILRATNAIGSEVYNDEIDTDGLSRREVWEKCVDVSNSHVHDTWVNVEMVYDF